MLRTKREDWSNLAACREKMASETAPWHENGPKKVQKGPQDGPERAEEGSQDGQVAPRWAQGDPKRPQDGQRWPQDGPKGPQIAPRWSQAPRWPKMAQDGQRWPQDGPKMGLSSAKMATKWPKIAEHGPKMARDSNLKRRTHNNIELTPPTSHFWRMSLAKTPFF